MEELKNLVKHWQELVIAAYAGGRRLTFEERQAGGSDETAWLAYSTIPAVNAAVDDGGKFLGLLPCVKVITVGLDIREYSRRQPEQQLFLTMCLHAAINRAIDLLRRSGMVSGDEPRVIVQTGDGAMVVFASVSGSHPAFHMDRYSRPEDAKKFAREKYATELRNLPRVAEQAFSFVFAMNCLLENDNRRQGFDVRPVAGSPSVMVFPVSVRYAMSYGNVLFLSDVNGALNCVGRGMITCYRILTTDHGNHFLIEENLLRALDPFGGVNGIAGGVWGQQLHWAMLQETKVKSSIVRYADVFGFHSDGPLLAVQGRHLAPGWQFQIGSHDVGTLDR